MSGGEQTRASLARLVIADPDLLLLDEPTNHLDLDALEWLEDHLRKRRGSLLVASHDRAFLDATVTRIWELRDRELTAFRGDYSAYHRQREERDARAVKDVDITVESIARERELVQRYRSHRKFSKMHEHEARLERLQAEKQEAPKAGRKLAIPTASLAGAGPTRSRRDRRPHRGPGGRLPAGPRRGAPPTGRPATEPRVVAHGRRSSPPSAASGSASSGRTAPARPRSCARSPGSCRRSTGRSRSGTRSSSATSPSCAARRSRGRPCSTR